MNKRGPMASACFIYSSGRMKKNNVRNNIKNFRNNVIVLSETSLDKGTQRKTTENELPSLTQCTA